MTGFARPQPILWASFALQSERCVAWIGQAETEQANAIGQGIKPGIGDHGTIDVTVFCSQIGMLRFAMSRFEDLSTAQIEIIKSSLWSRQYYLLTGSGVSLDSKGPRGAMVSASDLRKALCNYLSIPESRSLQQAYSLLSPDEITKFITDPYKCVLPGATVSKLSDYPWKRIFTFNVDDCLETALGKMIDQTELLDRLEIKNFMDDFSDFSPLKLQSIAHLHGLITQVSRGYVFSYAEYAKNIARPNSWMMTLVQLIRGEPFIVAGTSLDEIDVTYYLEQRNANSTRVDLAPSILIEPYPDRLTERLCENHELYLFKGTVLDFFSAIEADFGSPPAYWNVPSPNYLSSVSVPNRDKIAFEAAFEAVPRQVTAETRIAPFLLGAPITWAMLEARADIPREVFNGLLNAIQRHVKDRDDRILLLLDEPGAGKSALLRRLAYQLAKQERNVFFFTGLEQSAHRYWRRSLGLVTCLLMIGQTISDFSVAS